MIEATFISDLHLNPGEPLITQRFNAFIDWATENTRTLYILGDFFHAWSGDDAMDSWSMAIAERLSDLASKGITIYYMHGNRDFLLGQAFAKRAGWIILQEPTLIKLGDKNILLVHGDRYCTKDKSHQWFRRLTRNPLFSKLFLLLPLSLRAKLVNKVRQHSQENKTKSEAQMDVVPSALLRHMAKFGVHFLIHGHTHKPGESNYVYNNEYYHRYVLSDWDDSPELLCYDRTMGFYFERLERLKNEK